MRLNRCITFSPNLLLFRDDHGLERYEDVRRLVILTLRQKHAGRSTHRPGRGGTSNPERAV
jgi:hypothetical protein